MTNVTSIVTPLVYPTGQEIKALIRSWKVRTLANQAEAEQNGFNAVDYIIDLFADTAVEELDNETLAKLCRLATADRLRELGYAGARSNAGRNITTFYTAVLYAVKAEFGDNAVYNSGTWQTTFRGIRNTSEIRKFYTEETQRLIRRLLSPATTETAETPEVLTERQQRNKEMIEAHIARFRAGEKPITSGQAIVYQLMSGTPRDCVLELDGEPSNKASVGFYASLLQPYLDKKIN